MEKGADANAGDHNVGTPMIQNDKTTFTNVVELLVEHRADVNNRDQQGDTALIIAAEPSATNMVTSLLRAGADVNAMNHRGETALMRVMHGDYNANKEQSLLNITYNFGNSALITSTESYDSNNDIHVTALACRLQIYCLRALCKLEQVEAMSDAEVDGTDTFWSNNMRSLVVRMIKHFLLIYCDLDHIDIYNAASKVLTANYEDVSTGQFSQLIDILT